VCDAALVHDTRRWQNDLRGRTTPTGPTLERGAKHTEFLLDDLEDLLLVELLGQTLHRGQGLPSIPLLNADMYVVLSLDGIAGVLIGFGEGVCSEEIHGLVSENKLGQPKENAWTGPTLAQGAGGER
jgi:hypothetical protein